MDPDTGLRSLNTLKGTPVFLDGRRAGRLKELPLDPRTLDVRAVILERTGEADLPVPTERIRETRSERRGLSLVLEAGSSSHAGPTAGAARTGSIDAADLIGCRLAADGARCGVVVDAVIDIEKWAVRYVAVRKHPLLFWRKTLLPPLWIRSLDPSNRTIGIRLTRDAVQRAPEILSHAKIRPSFERSLIYHYGSDRYRLPADR